MIPLFFFFFPSFFALTVSLKISRLVTMDAIIAREFQIIKESVITSDWETALGEIQRFEDWLLKFLKEHNISSSIDDNVTTASSS